MNSIGRIRLLLALLLVIVALGALWYGLAYDERSDDPERGPATSWSEQLTVAMEKAEIRDRDWVLAGVSADPEYGVPRSLFSDLAFEVTFLFGKQGEGVFVVL